MQIANGTIILSPENHQYKRDVTPGEAMILYRLHRSNANGTPLGMDFAIQPGEAVTVDDPGRAAEEEYWNQATGRAVTAKPAIPPKTHPRTNAEEVQRLKKKYTGHVSENGVSLAAFTATFGNAIGVQLPQTFAEIEAACGHTFHQSDAVKAEPGDTILRRQELRAMRRPELCTLAVDTYKLKVKVVDSNDDIVEAVLQAEAKIEAERAAKAKEKNLAGLNT